MAPPPVLAVKTRLSGWVWALLIGLLILAAITLIWCVALWRTVDRLERHNRELVRWTREVQTFTEGVSDALWGPGGDPCCEPPKPPPELD